jgi:hypothetical protein
MSELGIVCASIFLIIFVGIGYQLAAIDDTLKRIAMILAENPNNKGVK